MLPALDPVDYGIVRAVFTSLVHADWFTRTDDNVAACAKLVISQYSEGVDADSLRATCEWLARERFGRTH
jgi:hypothetical protein